MTDEEKLRKAGWSPESLRLAFSGIDSPINTTCNLYRPEEYAQTIDRIALKRSPLCTFASPGSCNFQNPKISDFKSTPIHLFGDCSTIDLSVSTTKKAAPDLLQRNVMHLDTIGDSDDDFGGDDCVNLLTQNLRRQSIGQKDSKGIANLSRQSNYNCSDENIKPAHRNLNWNTKAVDDDPKCVLFSSQKLASKHNNDICKNLSVEEETSDQHKCRNMASAQSRSVSSNSSIKVEKDTVENNVNTSTGSQMNKLLEFADLENTLPNGWKLFKHQKEAVTECLKLGRSIMAFDMGLGKTLISLIWAKAICSLFTDCIAVIIVPCTLMEVWKREAEMIGFTSVNYLHEKSTSKNSKKSHLKNDKKMKISIHSWSKIPSAFELNRKYVLIADEAHAMQSITSIRTKNTLSLCSHKNCLGVILSTGTPMKNGRPSNILPLLMGIRHPISHNKIEFEKIYCNAKKTKFCAWDVSGASNLKELKIAIGPFLMRKTKEECLDLPALTRKTVKIEISTEISAQYDGIISTMKKKMKSNYSGNNANPHGAGNGSCLEMMSQLRIFSSKAKVPGTAQLIRNILKECSDPIVVFVWFKESSSLLQTELEQCQEYSKTSGKKDDNVREIRCECLTGDIIKHQLRQEMVDRFQNGEIDVLICTFGVGSTGLTLTRSHTVILLDRPWTPGDAAQAEDRVRRIGQLSSKVESIWIEAFELDKKLDSMLENKAKNTAKVLTSNYLQKEAKESKKDANSSKDKKEIYLKTLDDYFNPKRNETQSCDLDEKDIESYVAPDFGEEDEEDSDVIQSSIMKCVLKHVLK